MSRGVVFVYTNDVETLFHALDRQGVQDPLRTARRCLYQLSHFDIMQLSRGAWLDLTKLIAPISEAAWHRDWKGYQ